MTALLERGTDLRFDVPLYTISEAAWHLRMSGETLRRWVHRGDLVRSLEPETPRAARLPFMALVEAQFYHQLRLEGLSFEAVTVGMSAARRQLGEDFLVHGRLAHDGKDILVNLPDETAASEWMRARDQQGGLPRVIERGLRAIRWGDDLRPASLRLLAYEPLVSADPRYSFGQPTLEAWGVRVEDVVDLLRAGDPAEVVAYELGVPTEEVASIAHTHLREA